MSIKTCNNRNQQLRLMRSLILKQDSHLCKIQSELFYS
uniref:Uncharacterized protein n=1 Tax=Rhizophora mucronata TaxID=61149 RepID=A0A2P2N9Y8_RHIMU